MARIQILELPTEHHGDDMTTPFVLIIDQADDATRYALGPTDDTMYTAQATIAEAIGARTVLVFPTTIDIPANQVEVDGQSYPLVVKVEGDFEQFREQIGDEIRRGQAR